MHKFNITCWMATILHICSAIAIAENPATSNCSAKKAHTTELPDFDRIVIYALTGAPYRGDDRFPIRPYEGQVCKIAGEVEVTGKKAERVCELWRQLNYDNAEIIFCHLPPYGFRFYCDDKMMFETSMCWQCNNFYGPDERGDQVWYHFKNDKQSLRLLKVCRTYMRNPESKTKDAKNSRDE